MAEPRYITDWLRVVHWTEVELVRIGVYERLVTNIPYVLELTLWLCAHLRMLTHRMYLSIWRWPLSLVLLVCDEHGWLCQWLLRHNLVALSRNTFGFSPLLNELLLLCTLIILWALSPSLDSLVNGSPMQVWLKGTTFDFLYLFETSRTLKLLLFVFQPELGPFFDGQPPVSAIAIVDKLLGLGFSWLIDYHLVELCFDECCKSWSLLSW